MKPEAFYINIINNLCDGVYFTDTDRRITFWSKGAERISGYTPEEMVGLLCRDTKLDHIDNNGSPLCQLGCPLYSTVMDGKQRRANVYLRHKEGHRIPIAVNIFPIIEDGVITGAVEIFTQSAPINYEDKLIERLSNLAMNDSLTSAANRRKIETYMDFCFQELKCFKSNFCVIFMDIDNFGLFNNTYGHETGDKILKKVVKAVSASMRASDMFGRWGGEEFVGVFKINDKKDAIGIAEKIRALIESTKIPFDHSSLSVTVSIGVTIATEKDTIDSVVSRADALMYKSKRNNKNCVTSDII